MFLALLLMAACSTPPAPVVVPTIAVLPTLPPSATATASPVPSNTTTPTATLSPTATETPPPSSTATLPPTETPSATATQAPSQTFTPSLTITNTITPTASNTFTPTVELDGLGMLALLMERATILPPEMLYNPETLTAVAYAAETFIAAGFASSPTPVLGTPAIGAPILGTVGAPTAAITTTCVNPPPGSLATADPNLTQSIGCPQGLFFNTTTAVQTFERGTMIYVQGIGIYVLTSDGRFRRFDDTWVAGVDPETGGETPPLGLIEPKRGFGKVWRSNPDIRSALGWAVTDEQGATSDVQLFERGRAVFLPQRGESVIFTDDPGGLSGTWRALAASF
jgi:hypothetical protein